MSVICFNHSRIWAKHSFFSPMLNTLIVPNIVDFSFGNFLARMGNETSHNGQRGHCQPVDLGQSPTLSIENHHILSMIDIWFLYPRNSKCMPISNRPISIICRLCNPIFRRPLEQCNPIPGIIFDSFFKRYMVLEARKIFQTAVFLGAF